jgi:hypothetical protein
MFSHDQGHAAMPSCLGHVEEPWFLAQAQCWGLLVDAYCYRRMLPSQVGAIMSGRSANGGQHTDGLVYQSRYPVEAGAEAQGLESSPRGGGAS